MSTSTYAFPIRGKVLKYCRDNVKSFSCVCSCELSSIGNVQQTKKEGAINCSDFPQNNASLKKRESRGRECHLKLHFYEFESIRTKFGVQN